jgi:hypothetical protein
LNLVHHVLLFEETFLSTLPPSDVGPSDEKFQGSFYKEYVRSLDSGPGVLNSFFS